MPARKKGARVLGPYPHPRGGWRVVLVEADGTRDDRKCPTEAAARALIEDLQSTLVDVPATVGEALERYQRHLIAKGNKPRSYEETIRRLGVFFSDSDRALGRLTPSICRTYYEDLVAATKEVRRREGEREIVEAVPKYKPDSHRNYLAEARSFLRWAVDQRWLAENPLDGVRGQGRRTHGKLQLRLDEARKWETKALELAHAGDVGALGALLALYLGMRASEIVDRQVRDLDDGGRLLWIPESKTAAGRRTLLVPDEIRPLLARLTREPDPENPGAERDRKGDAPLFGEHWRDWVRENVQRICRLAEVPEVTAHGMRGLCATLGMLRALHGAGAPGASAADVPASLGHADERTTRTSYADRSAVAAATQQRGLSILRGGRP